MTKDDVTACSKCPRPAAYPAEKRRLYTGFRNAPVPSFGARHAMPGGIVALNSHHTSRYNINAGRLTEAMPDAITRAAKELANE